MARPKPAPAQPSAPGVSALRDAAEEAALRLSGDDVEADLEELAALLERLEADCSKILGAASGALKSRLERAKKHFHEARDLLDDGEPADAVALEVMAGREELPRAAGRES